MSDVDKLVQIAEEQRQRNQIADAAESLEAATRLADEQDDQSGLAVALNNLGNLYGQLKRDSEAEVALRRSLEVAETHNLPEMACSALNNLGNHYRVRQEFDKAGAAYRDVLSRYENMDDRHGQVSALGYLGMLEEARGDIKAARGYWEQGLALGKEIFLSDLRYFEEALARTRDLDS